MDDSSHGSSRTTVFSSEEEYQEYVEPLPTIYPGHGERYRSRSPPRRTPAPAPPSPPRGPFYTPSWERESKERTDEPFDPWRDSGAVRVHPVEVPGFVMKDRGFEYGRVDELPDFVSSLPADAARRAREWIKTVKDLHWDFLRHHADAMHTVFEMERSMRRLEAPPEEWLRLGLDKVAPMPEELKRFCRGEGR